MAHKNTVLVAGVPRSGSTWCFNALRMLLQHNALDFHAAWCGDYDSENAANWHLVKAHKPEEVSFEPSITITSYRDASECIASLLRMGWLTDEPDAIRQRARAHTALYDHWKSRSDFEVAYADIISAPERVIEELARSLSVSGKFASLIATQLQEMEPPAEGNYNPMTLLHPNHRGNRNETQEKAAQVKALLCESGLGS